MVACHQHFDVRQGDGLHQPQLPLLLHVAGDEHISLPHRGQHREAQFVGAPGARHGRENGNATGELDRLPDKTRRDTLFLRDGGNLCPEGVVRLHVGEDELPYRHPVKQLGDTIGVVGVVVGHHQQVDVAAAQGLEVVGGHVPRVVPAVPAAVHQSEEITRPHQHALPLAHVQNGDRQVSLIEGSPGEGHGQHQPRRPGGQGHPHRPPALCPDEGQHQGVHQHQPGPVVHRFQGQRCQGGPGQQVDHPLEVMGQSRKGDSQHSRQTGQDDGQRPRPQPAQKQKADGPQGEQVGQRRDQGDHIEVERDQRYGQHRGP